MTWIERLQKAGIRRLGSPGEGFRYETPGGSPISAADRERIDALRLPPAWTDVYVNPAARGALQAIGRDAAGRWQYRYHESHVRRREAAKRSKMVAFGRALPALRRKVAHDLDGDELTRERVLAACVRILSKRFLRPGSRDYLEENNSYGLVTLKKRHVSVSGDVVRFRFRGKAGKEHDIALEDAAVARVVAACAKLPGPWAFQFVGEDGKEAAVRRKMLNEYIKEAMGQRFSAKDFRTWAGTLLCASALARTADRSDGPRARKRKVAQAIRETAERLGNTPAICRQSYVAPAVLEGFENGKVLDPCIESIEELVERPRLHRVEQALLRLLGDGGAAA